MPPCSKGTMRGQVRTNENATAQTRLRWTANANDSSSPMHLARTVRSLTDKRESGASPLAPTQVGSTLPGSTFLTMTSPPRVLITSIVSPPFNPSISTILSPNVVGLNGGFDELMIALVRMVFAGVIFPGSREKLLYGSTYAIRPSCSRMLLIFLAALWIVLSSGAPGHTNLPLVNNRNTACGSSIR